jgi:hypothetical protein
MEANDPFYNHDIALKLCLINSPEAIPENCGHLTDRRPRHLALTIGCSQ